MSEYFLCAPHTGIYLVSKILHPAHVPRPFLHYDSSFCFSYSIVTHARPVCYVPLVRESQAICFRPGTVNIASCGCSHSNALVCKSVSEFRHLLYFFSFYILAAKLHCHEEITLPHPCCHSATACPDYYLIRQGNHMSHAWLQVIT